MGGLVVRLATLVKVSGVDGNPKRSQSRFVWRTRVRSVKDVDIALNMRCQFDW